MRFPIGSQHLSYVRNGLDNLGLLLNLPRLPQEDNASYRARLEDVYTRPGNATYQGLVASLGREFGFRPQEAIAISSSAALARVILTQQTLYLYTSPGQLEAFWFLREPQVETLTQLVAAINTTEHFQAALTAEMTGEELSQGLLHDDSHAWVLGETVPASRSFHLAHADIIPGSVVFDEEAIFRRHVTTPSQPGDFFLDPATGLVKTTLLPSGAGKVAYQYRRNQLTLSHLPISLLDLNAPAARGWFFSTVPTDVWETFTDRVSPAFPHPFMQKIITEINQNCPALWGA